jgi:hypothetical protein
MFQLNKKTIVLILIVVIAVAGIGVGAAMYKPAKVTTKAPVAVVKSRENPPVSGWIASPGASTPGPTTAAVSVSTNGTELVSVSVNITIKDDDGQHTQTDGGSDPDTVTVKIGNDTFKMTTDKASGMVSQAKEYGADKVSTFGKNISVSITGETFGGGKHPTGPGGIVPIPFLVYVDQGCAYSVEIKYTYNDYGGSGGSTK